MPSDTQSPAVLPAAGDHRPGALSPESRRLAGILLILLPTVAFGGTSILRLLISDPAYMDNELRRSLWAAGHAHAGVFLVLSLVALRYVDDATLSARWKQLVRHAVPAAAVLVPAGMFLSVLHADATDPNALINLAYVGGACLAVGLVTLGVGLLRTPRGERAELRR